jgi:hypothetical protein
VVRPASVRPVRVGRRNRFRMPYSHGKNRSLSTRFPNRSKVQGSPGTRGTRGQLWARQTEGSARLRFQVVWQRASVRRAFPHARRRKRLRGSRPIARRRSKEQRTNFYAEFSPRHRTARRRIEAVVRELPQNGINFQVARSEEGEPDRQNEPILGKWSSGRLAEGTTAHTRVAFAPRALWPWLRAFALVVAGRIIWGAARTAFRRGSTCRDYRLLRHAVEWARQQAENRQQYMEGAKH